MNIRMMINVLSALGVLRERDRWTRPQLEAYQAESLRGLRAHAYDRSPFYMKFHKGLAGRPLKDLPVLTKAMMMEEFDELVTDRAVRLDAVREYAAGPGEGGLFLGRMEEVIHLPSIDGRVIAVHPNTFHEIMEGLPVSGWQIVEEAEGLNVFLSGSPDAADEKLAERLIQALRVQGARDLRVKVQRVSSIPRAASGKAPLIKSGRLKKSEKHIEE